MIPHDKSFQEREWKGEKEKKRERKIERERLMKVMSFLKRGREVLCYLGYRDREYWKQSPQY